MPNDMQRLIENAVELDKDSVWVLVDKKEFNYCDGRPSEYYLEKAFLQADDLSSGSYELEHWIRDWPSEYYLTRKRAQLLSGFDFGKSKRVLEIGSGCGAITRFLGERFEEVVAVEGSRARARLSRLRTKDMENVSIVCAPFQEIRFKERFDIVFCIGVFEYSKMFVDAAEPFDFILQNFHDVLKPDGELIIAIENQFGLKYFSSCPEDHNNIMFDGLEGYPRYSGKERTFGYYELGGLLRKHFQKVNFYFPYPDYKTPSCILSEEFFDKVKAGELIGAFRPSNYMNVRKPLFDERLTLLELERNDSLGFFANSFLVVAGKQNVSSTRLPCLGIIYSSDRIEQLQTVTRFVEHEDGSIWGEKELLSGRDRVKIGMLTLRSCKSRWAEGQSIHTQVMKRAKDRSITMGEMFEPCRIWLETLKSMGSYQGDTLLLDGKYVDYLWHNSYVRNGKCIFIDHEMEWDGKISINVLLIRSIYTFLNDISSMTDLTKALRVASTRRLIGRIAESLGVTLTRNDFKEFCRLESTIAQTVCGKSSIRVRVYMLLTLWNRSLLSFMLLNVKILRKVLRKLHNIILTSGFTVL